MSEAWVSRLTSDIGWLNSTNALMAEAWSRHSIYDVPDTFKRISPQIHKPSTCSIGPRYNGDLNLLRMERHKHRALLNFLIRCQVSIHDIIRALRKNLHDFRACYQDLDTFWMKNDDEFLKIMIYDGAFMIEIMIATVEPYERTPSSYHAKDPIFKKPYLVEDLRVDMLRLDNQIPMKVLEILSKFCKNKIQSIHQLIRHFFFRKYEEGRYDISQTSTIFHLPEITGHHLLDVYKKTLIQHGGYHHTSSRQPLSAVELQEAGVIFQCSETLSLTDICFTKGVLCLPAVDVDEAFEVVMRNLIAYEQAHGEGQEVTSYVFFMDGIVNNDKDIALLREKGIIRSGVSSDKRIADLFNGLTKGIVAKVVDNVDVDVTKDINEYCNRRWNRWQANFKQRYFANPWAFPGIHKC
ncbi:UPF0481 protein At3g47200-like [Asparagus officinalis]|uniref:UPF0481 protein At3g47200-like n=1 Tax=Asparagus officinalis TaxID=4686 RepID=UPI00098E3AC2|nr:UPF0481 protein At3g47200-like [Asparagus officinalis]